MDELPEPDNSGLKVFPSPEVEQPGRPEVPPENVPRRMAATFAGAVAGVLAIVGSGMYVKEGLAHRQHVQNFSHVCGTIPPRLSRFSVEYKRPDGTKFFHAKCFLSPNGEYPWIVSPADDTEDYLYRPLKIFPDYNSNGIADPDEEVNRLHSWGDARQFLVVAADMEAHPDRYLPVAEEKAKEPQAHEEVKP